MRLYMTHYPEGNLEKFIRRFLPQYRVIFPEIAVRIAIGIAEGLKACHDRGIIHRNLEPSIIHLAYSVEISDLCWMAVEQSTLGEEHRAQYDTLCRFLDGPSGSTVIADFRRSEFVGASQNKSADGVVGGFAAPECLGPNGYSSVKSDIYNFGCILFRLFESSKMPSERNRSTMRLRTGTKHTAKAQELIWQCIDTKPESRPDINAVLQTLSNMLEEWKAGPTSTDILKEYINSQLPGQSPTQTTTRGVSSYAQLRPPHQPRHLSPSGTHSSAEDSSEDLSRSIDSYSEVSQGEDRTSRWAAGRCNCM